MSAAPRRAELIELLVALLAVLAAAALLNRYFSGYGWMVPLAGALALGAAPTTYAVAHARRYGAAMAWPVLAPVLVVLLVVYEIYALHRGETSSGLPGPDAWVAMGSGIRSGWARMLSTSLPGDPTGDLLALPVTVLFLAGVGTALLVLRSNLLVATTLPALATLVLCLLLTASAGGTALAATAVTVALLVGLLLLRASRVSATEDGIGERDAGAVGVDLGARGRHSTTGRVLFGAPAVGVVVALAAAGAWFGPIDGHERKDPRNVISPPVSITDELSPLVQVRPQLEGARTTLYEVTVPTGQQRVTAVRIAALEGFNGAIWSQTGEFVRAGTHLPKPDADVRDSRVVKLTVRVVATSATPYLPVVGMPLVADGVDTAVQAESGNLVTVGKSAARPATAGQSYDLVGSVSSLIGVDTAGVAPGGTALTALPDPPDWVLAAAQRITEGQTTPWLVLQSLEKVLYERPYSLKARPGESYGSIFRVVLGSDADRFGYAEQHASAFAVLARSLGYPARVAVGYRLDEATRKGDTYTVTTADAHAWPEVELAGYGWVPFEPTNPANDASSPPPQAPDVAPIDDTAQQPKEAAPDDSADSGATPGGATVLVSAGRAVLVAVLVVLAVLVLLVVGVVGAKARRRSRRRRRGSPADRITAAWAEVCDRLREAGFFVAVDQTAADVARAAAAAPGGTAERDCAQLLQELSIIVTGSVFAPESPSEPAAERAWELQSEVGAALAAGRSTLARLRGTLDPRALFRRQERTVVRPLYPIRVPVGKGV